MNIMLFPKMVLSPAKAWPEIEKAHPSRIRILLTLVVPFALLPPAMLFYAGTHYGDSFVQGFGEKPWALLAPALLLLEMLTFAVMVRLIKSIADTYDTGISSYDALLLAAISVIPIFLSSLALAVPNLGFNAVALFFALCYACIIFYRGAYTLSHMQESLFAAHFTYTAVGVSAAWIGLMMLMILLV